MSSIQNNKLCIESRNKCKNVDKEKHFNMWVDINSDSDDLEDPQKIVVPADAFSNFEELKLSHRKSSESSCSSTENKSGTKRENAKKLNETPVNNYSRYKLPKKTLKTADFESVTIKNEIPENADNKIKMADRKKYLKVGESLDAVTLLENLPVVNKTCSETHPTKKSVYIIKNLAGKKVTLIPKNAPVVLNSPMNKPIVQNCIRTENNTKTVAPNSGNNKKLVFTRSLQTVWPKKLISKTVDLNKDKDKTEEDKPEVTKPEKINETVKQLSKTEYTTVTIKNKNNQKIQILKPVDANNKCQNLIKVLPNTRVMKIGDLNKSQKYFNGSKAEFIKQKLIKTDNLAKKYPEITAESSGPKTMKNNVEFSEILQALTGSSQNTSAPKTINLQEAKIPIYVDNTTQTENLKEFKDQSVQTDSYVAPTPVVDHSVPDISNLLEYVLNVPQYSTGLDESKKSDLINMSKNIVTKGKEMTKVHKSQDWLKRQLFLDLKDCISFDFLGNKPLHNAVLENNLNFLKRQIFALRIRRMSLDIENNQRQTALQLAVINNCNIEIISTLLISGATANILDDEGNTLIHLAVMYSTHTVLELLIKYLKEPVREVNRKNDEGLTALMIASIDQKPEIVDMLLRNNADPNLRDEKSGRTALFHAVELNSNYVINLLLKYRADPKIRNYFGLTALDAAKDLDMQDSKILESEKEASQASTIANMGANDSTNTQSGSVKRRLPLKNIEDDAKKMRFDIVSSYRKVGMNNIRNAMPSRRGRKKREN